MTTDASGNTYITGVRRLNQAPAFSTDIFLAKQDASGNAAFSRRHRRNGGFSVSDRDRPVRQYLRRGILELERYFADAWRAVN